MLQKTFEIQSEKPYTDLLHIEIGPTHVLLNSFNADNIPAAQFEFYNYDSKDSWASTWSTLIQEATTLSGGIESFGRVQLSWENDWVQSIPRPLYQSGLETALLSTNKGALAEHQSMVAHTKEYSFPFSVPLEVYQAVLDTFPNATHSHKYAGVVKQLSGFSTAYPMQVLLVFYQDHFILCAFKGEQLQAINTHKFDGGTAIIYHVLNAIRQTGGQLDQTCVHLSGLIDGDSALYREIYKFVPIIDVDQLGSAPFLGQQEHYPSHFFVPFYKYI